MFRAVLIIFLINANLYLGYTASIDVKEKYYLPLLNPPDQTRSPVFNFGTCKKNESWMPCIAPCPATCDNPYGVRDCVDKQCIPGCDCTFPLVRDGNLCIDVNQCLNKSSLR